jgi:hypothetical protein
VEDNTFPMDFYVDDPSPRPWKFHPEGYLVVILASTDEGQRAVAALLAAGFAAHGMKVYPGKQILEDYELYASRRALTDRATELFVHDLESKELYLGYAREDRCALWLRLPDEDDAGKALRVLADSDYLFARYYGSDKQTDFRVS